MDRSQSLLSSNGSGTAASGIERRRAKRRDIHAPGSVRIPGYRKNLGCEIIDISATGARIRLTNEHAERLPDCVIVGFTTDFVEIDAAIIWTSRREAGVRFLSGFRRDGNRSAAAG